MTIKIAFNSVVKGVASWIALIVASITLSIVLTLNIALVAAGISVQGEAQQAFISMGGVALSFSLLTGIASLISVISVCVRLQRRDVALWQTVGLLPRTAFIILLIEITLVALASAAIGALAAFLLWPLYADFISTSGLPYSAVLEQAIPPAALFGGVGTTLITSAISALRASAKLVQENIIEGTHSETAFHAQQKSLIARGTMFAVGFGLLVGVGAIYGAIGHGDAVTDPRALGDLLTTYPGMGLLLCLIFAIIGKPFIRFISYLTAVFSRGRVSSWLATSEVTARPRLTHALTLPISLAAAAVGIIMGWIDKLRSVLEPATNSANSVSAPPEQLAILLGGPVLIACVAASSIVFATARNRQQDNSLILITGATPSAIYSKVVVEALFYTVITLVCAYIIVFINDLAMVTALSSGPIPSVTFAPPSWTSASIAVFGGLLTLVMLLFITSSGMQKKPITTVTKGK